MTDKKQIKQIVLALNSTGPNYGDPFPFGNKELHAITMKLYQESKITFNKITGLWRVGK